MVENRLVTQGGNSSFTWRAKSVTQPGLVINVINGQTTISINLDSELK